MSNPPPPPGSDDRTEPNEPPPPSPYGPPLPQAAYGQPAPDSQPPPEREGRGLAITALVLAIIPVLNIVGFALALVVLAGRKAGKGLAVAALVLSLAWAAVFLALALVAGSLFGAPINDLETGQCITADGLTSGEGGVSQVEVVGCDEPHDAEVLAVQIFDADQAAAYEPESGSEACVPILDTAVIAALPQDVAVTALTPSEQPDEGDQLACIAYQADGGQLIGGIG